tara:strand:+ start:307 stop:996 length:690 start_codon:yes stop_codon:yes gene_type:complete
MSFINNIKNAVNPTRIDDFKSIFSKRGGAAQPNRFAIFMTPPSQTLLDFDLQGAASQLLSGSFEPTSFINDPRDIALLCESCSIPGKQVTTVDYSDYRQPIKLPNGYINTDVDFTFLLTNDFYIRKMFDKWVDAIIPRNSYRVNYRNEYSTDVVIQQLNRENVPVYGVRLTNAFPITLNAVELSNASTDEISKVTVTLAYEDYFPEKPIKSALSSIDNVIGGIRTGGII